MPIRDHPEIAPHKVPALRLPSCHSAMQHWYLITGQYRFISLFLLSFFLSFFHSGLFGKVLLSCDSREVNFLGLSQLRKIILLRESLVHNKTAFQFPSLFKNSAGKLCGLCHRKKQFHDVHPWSLKRRKIQDGVVYATKTRLVTFVATDMCKSKILLTGIPSDANALTFLGDSANGADLKRIPVQRLAYSGMHLCARHWPSVTQEHETVSWFICSCSLPIVVQQQTHQKSQDIFCFWLALKPRVSSPTMPQWRRCGRLLTLALRLGDMRAHIFAMERHSYPMVGFSHLRRTVASKDGPSCLHFVFLCLWFLGAPFLALAEL